MGADLALQNTIEAIKQIGIIKEIVSKAVICCYCNTVHEDGLDDKLNYCSHCGKSIVDYGEKGKIVFLAVSESTAERCFG